VVNPLISIVENPKFMQMNLPELPNRHRKFDDPTAETFAIETAAVLQLFEILLTDKEKHFLHVTGPSQYEDFVNQAQALGLKMTNNGNITIVPYLNEMPLAMKAADLAVCRAGASTLAELTAAGLPAILIPYPYAAGNHQEHNARSMVNQGAALLVREQELSGVKLAEIIGTLFDSPDILSSMARNSKKISRPQALADILEMIATFI